MALPLPLVSGLTDESGGGGGGGCSRGGWSTALRAEESGRRRPWYMKRRRLGVERRLRRRCLRERTVVECGLGMSRSRSGMEVEKRMVRRRGAGGRGGCVVGVMMACRGLAG